MVFAGRRDERIRSRLFAETEFVGEIGQRAGAIRGESPGHGRVEKHAVGAQLIVAHLKPGVRQRPDRAQRGVGVRRRTGEQHVRLTGLFELLLQNRQGQKDGVRRHLVCPEAEPSELAVARDRRDADPQRDRRVAAPGQRRVARDECRLFHADHDRISNAHAELFCQARVNGDIFVVRSAELPEPLIDAEHLHVVGAGPAVGQGRRAAQQQDRRDR